MKRFGYSWLILLLVFTVIIPACGGKEPQVEEVEPVEEVPPPPPIEEEKMEEPEVEEVTEDPIVLKDVFYEFDKYNIQDEYKDILIHNAEEIMARDGISIVIEGHCDERGTNEYNLALGEKRAKAARDFLVAYGVDPDKLSIISYGEEKPFALGSNEEAWAKNRRAHFVVK
jgi:peptidoglycan-associated lipoprotein